jgi:hypothetical protein
VFQISAFVQSVGSDSVGSAVLPSHSAQVSLLTLGAQGGTVRFLKFGFGIVFRIALGFALEMRLLKSTNFRTIKSR